jgi:hypothetical protein
VPGKDNGGEGLSVFDSIVLVSSVRAYRPVGEAIRKGERVASFGGVGLGLLEVGRRRRPALGLRGWTVVSESVLAFVFYFRFVSGVGKFSTVGRAFYSRCE